MTDTSYKKYSLEQLDNWLFDAINCDDITPHEIYDVIVKTLKDNVEHHKKHMNKNLALLSLLKVSYPTDYLEKYENTPFLVTDVSAKDWEDFWNSSDE